MWNTTVQINNISYEPLYFPWKLFSKVDNNDNNDGISGRCKKPFPHDCQELIR